MIVGRKTGHIALRLVELDISSYGEYWGTDFLTAHGVISHGSDSAPKHNEYLAQAFGGYDYWYTAEVMRDIHVDFDDVPDAVAAILDPVRYPQQALVQGDVAME